MADPAGVPADRSALANGALELVIDPVTRDLSDAVDGGFVESTDSRTTVLFQLESTYKAWWGDANTGSRIKAILRGDDPATAQDVADEVLRVLQPLVAEGVISELIVALDVPSNVGGSLVVVLINYRDQASGQLVDLSWVPFGG